MKLDESAAMLRELPQEVLMQLYEITLSAYRDLTPMHASIRRSIVRMRAVLVLGWAFVAVALGGSAWGGEYTFWTFLTNTVICTFHLWLLWRHVEHFEFPYWKVREAREEMAERLSLAEAEVKRRGFLLPVVECDQ